MSPRTRPLLMVGLAVGLLATACGPDRTPTETTAPTSAPAPTEAPAADDDVPPGDDDTGADDDVVVETTAPPDVPMFGDLEMPCNGGDTSAYPASAKGVTADTINVGTGDDRGFAVSPGLSIEIGQAMEAIVGYCNELGGINGRRIDLHNYDAALFEVSNAMLEACQSDFMLVGQGWVADGTAERTRVECGLYSVPTYSVSPEFAHGPFMIQPLPNPGDQHGVGQIALAEELYPEELTKTAVLFGNAQATVDTKDKVLSAAADVGIDLGEVFELEYNAAGEDDWSPFVLQMKNRDIEHLYFVGTCLPNLVGVMEIASLNDWEPVLTLESNFYLDVCAEANTNGALDGALVRIVFYPFEEADQFPAIQQYVELLDATGGKKSQLGMQAMSAFLLWATGARACGADLTPECVFEQIQGIEEWTGGGLHVPSNPASNENPGCEMTMMIEGTGYVRVSPEEVGAYECEGNRGQVTGSVVDRLQLDDNRVSTLYTG